MPAPNPLVSVRVSPSERDLLEAAAAQARTNLSDFMRRKALEAAELALLDHRIITIPAADWERFEAWALAPAKQVPALRDLAAAGPAWQD
ncbi:MAG: DUF1778 domain-containing protein [Acidocella sp.]|nr:DUF1778 domain-containing protein [Acidocella sp.]